jgi:hypothetical protein
MVMCLHHPLLDHRLLALNRHSRNLVPPRQLVLANTDMEIRLHSKGVVRSKVRVTLGLGLTHGNDDFATGQRSGAKTCFGADLESVVFSNGMIRQIPWKLLVTFATEILISAA